MSDPLGQSQVLPYLCGLSQLGYSFSLISFEKPDRFPLDKQPIQQVCDQYGITWYPLNYTQRPPVISTLKDLLTLWKLVQTIHHSNPISLVHCRSYITSLIGLRMKKKWGVPFLFDMRGFWADERVDGKIWNLKNPLYRSIYRFFKKKEKQFIEGADHTISLTEQARSIIHEWPRLKRQPVPITVIPCCVDLKHFDPSSTTSDAKLDLRRRLNINNSAPVLSYVGSIGTWYMLPEMMAFFVRWLNKFPDSIFLFISQDDPTSIMKQATKVGVPVDKIRICGANRSEMPLFISISDCSLFFIKPVFSKKASSPTKQGEIMSMGVPVICNSGVGDTDSVIRTWHSGLLVDRFTQENYDEVIDAFCKSKFDPVEIRKGAQDYFSLEEGVSRYRRVYEMLLGEIQSD
jgi:glycosyltransferase involved in cell wall biosynthesis